MRHYFDKKEDYFYGFIIFIVFSAVLLLFRDSLFPEYTMEEKEAIKQEILSQIDDSTLCKEIYGETVERNGDPHDEGFEEEFPKLNEYQRNFFIAQGLNQDMADSGVGLYLYNSRCFFIDDIATVLTEFGLQDFANLWSEFRERPDIDWEAMVKEVQEYDHWNATDLLESIYAKYPLKEFDEAFYALNQDDLITDVLSKYARANIAQYDYGRIDERHLIQ